MHRRCFNVRKLANHLGVPLMTRPFKFFLLPLTIFIGFLMTGPSAVADSDLTSAARAVLGKEIAKLWCSHCHLVEPTDTGNVQSDVITFREIANREGQSELRMQKFMMDPHPPMPKLELTREDRHNLVAYILSLKDRE